MEELAKLYGKTYHLWQVDRGDEVPLGAPMLMGSFLKETKGVEMLGSIFSSRGFIRIRINGITASILRSHFGSDPTSGLESP
ncbi:unnamed protein product [Tuber melanosporum]|uniref:(Perigord truffle) hypothetical protein n=1 Tax=Tuber melanosporum (strain Mel28) TaxID=656061 RepID=D5GJ44_TUBMM|nr:uncharacterized protein GSTUM_00008833001 [Tuber melanosporum]CAZ84537.1 unnamed protein product [Tuber melanosporum]